MANRGGQPGNQNGAKGKPWSEALNRALETHKPADRREALDALAKSLVAQAMGGDIQALKEIGDRLDGKPKQQMELSQDPDAPLFEMTADDRQREIARYLSVIARGAGQVSEAAQDSGKPH